MFDAIKRAGSDIPVLHHIRFAAGASRDEIVIKTGSWVGGLLVDGLGDGAMIEAEGEDLDFLRTTSFGLLQVRALHEPMTASSSCAQLTLTDCAGF